MRMLKSLRARPCTKSLNDSSKYHAHDGYSYPVGKLVA
jgi:hypothetical protein